MKRTYKTHNKSFHHHSTLIVGLGLLMTVLVLAGAIAILIYPRLLFVDYLSYQYQESADALDNPYIGWYTIQGYLLSEDASFSLPQQPDATEDTKKAEELRRGLSLIEINLKNYAECDLTASALSQVDSILSAWSKTGNQLILRFLYDWDGQNLQSEPKELSQILKHMEQVGPIINSYASSVYLIQGIFVGNWGEMNNTVHMGDGQMQTLIEKLADVTDPSIFLSMRTPAQLRSIVKNQIGNLIQNWIPVDKTLAFNGTLPSRLGLYNDGMLGSANDTGTYGDKKAPKIKTSSNDTNYNDMSLNSGDTNYSDAWIREDELAFQNELCQYVPNGGEVIIDNEYNDFDHAIRDLAMMHVSYLNSAYDATVLDKWKASVYHADNVSQSNLVTDTNITNTEYSNSVNVSDAFDGMNGYDYVERHLGYRYVLRDSKLKFHPLFDDSAVLTVDVENVGFANCYRPLDATVAVVSNATGKCVSSVNVDTDPRFWNSGEKTSFTVPIDVRGLEKEATYTIYLSCADMTLGRTILFGNEQELTEYGYEVGEVTVSEIGVRHG